MQWSEDGNVDLSTNDLVKNSGVQNYRKTCEQVCFQTYGTMADAAATEAVSARENDGSGYFAEMAFRAAGFLCGQNG